MYKHAHIIVPGSTGFDGCQSAKYTYILFAYNVIYQITIDTTYKL